MNDDLTLGSRVVFKMTDIVENLLSLLILFENYSTSSDLLAHFVKEVMKQQEH